MKMTNLFTRLLKINDNTPIIVDQIDHQMVDMLKEKYTKNQKSRLSDHKF